MREADFEGVATRNFSPYGFRLEGNDYLCGMFVEKKLNKSGSTSVRIMQKVRGKRKCVKVMGCSSDTEEIGLLIKRGNRWIEEHQTGVPLFEFDDEAAAYDRVLAGLRQSQLRLVGPELVYGTLFDRIGYDKVKTSDKALFRALVVTRLYHHGSKLRTAEYMERFMHKSYSLDAIYRFPLTIKDRRYVVSMSDSRAKKDARDRDKGIKRLEKRFASGKITKASVNNRGYNRFLALQGEATVTIDQDKIAEDARLDGLKGYVTNSKNRNKAVVENYRSLPFIERAFRMNKTDLAIRPVYHRLFNRIEAHVCICFTAYSILLELERALRKTADKKNKKPGITIYRAKFLAESLYEIEYVNPYNGKKMSVMLRTDYDEEVVKLFDAIGLKP